jgi:hypothetical protein
MRRSTVQSLPLQLVFPIIQGPNTAKEKRKNAKNAKTQKAQKTRKRKNAKMQKRKNAKMQKRKNAKKRENAKKTRIAKIATNLITIGESFIKYS